MQNEPNWDVAHLGHAEIFPPNPREAFTFLRDVLGLTGKLLLPYMLVGIWRAMATRRFE